MPRARIGTNGGRNICLVAAIKDGEMSTTAGEYMIFDMTKTSQIGSLAKGISGKTISLSSYMNNSDLDTFIATYGSDAVETADPIKFEDGEEYVATASEVVKLGFVLLGGTASGKIQTFYGACALNDGDISQEYNTPTERPITITTQGWNGASALSIPAGIWDLLTKKDGTTKHLKTVTPTPSLPTTLAVGVASVVNWFESAS
jgi:hypothetical protein